MVIDFFAPKDRVVGPLPCMAEINGGDPITTETKDREVMTVWPTTLDSLITSWWFQIPKNPDPSLE